MPDMLVKLYDLPEMESGDEFAKRTGITVRRAITPEKHVVTQWIGQRFGPAWVSECEAAFSRTPVTCLVAVEDGRLLGFSCYDATMKGFFGPMGVEENDRGRGIGKVLFLRALQFMHSDGYGYAIVGGAGPTDFYAQAAGATIIENSKPGIYKGMLK